MADKVATFAVNLEGNAGDVAKRDAAELEGLRAKIEASQNAMKGLSQSYRSLKGSSDEIAAAKSELKAKLEAEKGAVSQATLALVKQGTSYAQVTAEAKKTAAANDKIKASVKAAAGPFENLTKGAKSLTGELAGAGSGMSALAGGAAVLVAAVAAVGVAAAATAYKLGEFVLQGANTLRAMGLVREAASGSADDAAALGTQVDMLAGKVSTSKERLNEMGAAITKNLSGGLSRASGQAIVDTFAAVAQASDAMGDEVGNTLKGLVERGKTWNRFSLSPQDLQGMQLQFQEVAQALAKNLNIGIAEARTALFNGRVSLDAGAKALRDAVDKRFGEVNAKKLLDLNVVIAKVKENFIGLTKDALPLLEPVFAGLAKLGDLFSQDSANGQALKEVFTTIASAMGAISPDVFDELKIAIETVVNWVLKLELALVHLNQKFKNFGGLKGFAGMSLQGGGGAATVGEGGGGGEEIDVDKMFGPHPKAVADAKAAANSMGDGLADGIRAQKDKVADASRDLAKSANQAFTNAQGIQSPSKVWAGYGRDTGEGYAQGIDDSAPQAQGAADRLAPRAPAGGVGGGAAPQVNFTMIVNLPESMSHAKATEVAGAMQTASFLGQLTKALREALVSGGIPTQAQAAP
jgi:hypothetical protein